MIQVEHTEAHRPSWKVGGSGVGYVRLSYSKPDDSVIIESREFDSDTNRSRITYVHMPLSKVAEFLDKVNGA